MASSKVAAIDESLHKATNVANSKQYICATCGKTLASTSGFRRHMLAHRDKPFKCSICAKTFTERHHYQGHVNSHQNVKLFNCLKCKKTFSYKASFTRHKSVCQIKNKKEFVCDICKMKFQKKDILKDHIKGKHTSYGFYVCDICGKQYKWRASRANHMKLAH